MPLTASAAQRRLAVAEARAIIATAGLDWKDLQALEHQLQRERQKAKDIAAHQARQLVEFWALTEADLSGPQRRSPAREAVKYTHPVTGQ